MFPKKSSLRKKGDASGYSFPKRGLLYEKGNASGYSFPKRGFLRKKGDASGYSSTKRGFLREKGNASAPRNIPDRPAESECLQRKGTGNIRKTTFLSSTIPSFSLKNFFEDKHPTISATTPNMHTFCTIPCYITITTVK